MGEVVIDLALGDLLIRERDVKVVVEVAAERRHPIETPPHAGLERFDIRERRSRDCDIGHVMVFEVHERPFDVVAFERATGAALLPIRPIRKVLDDHLAATVEETSERLLAVRRVEEILPPHLDPGQRAALNASRSRVRSCSLARCDVCAASHSSYDTIL